MDASSFEGHGLFTMNEEKSSQYFGVEERSLI